MYNGLSIDIFKEMIFMITIIWRLPVTQRSSAAVPCICAKAIAELVKELEKRDVPKSTSGVVIPTGGCDCGLGSFSIDKDGNQVHTTYKNDRKIIEVIYAQKDGTRCD